MSHVSIMSVKVNKCTHSQLRRIPTGELGGVERHCVLYVHVCAYASGSEVRMKVRKFRDFQHHGINLKTRLYH